MTVQLDAPAIEPLRSYGENGGARDTGLKESYTFAFDFGLGLPSLIEDFEDDGPQRVRKEIRETKAGGAGRNLDQSCGVAHELQNLEMVIDDKSNRGLHD